jgi:signal transduction histidine kinase
MSIQAKKGVARAPLSVLLYWLLALGVLWVMPVAAQPAVDDIIDPTLIRISHWQVLSNAPRSQAPPATQGADWIPLARAPVLSARMPGRDIRWFSADFTLGWHHKTRDLAISIGALRGADTVFVNGTWIGGSGAFDNGFHAPAAKTRVYRLPRNRLWFSFLDFERSNRLLIGIRSDVEPIEVDVGAVEIGDYEVLALKARDADTGIKIIQGAAVTLLLLLSVFSLFLRLNGYRSLANNLFGLFALVLSLSIAATSLLLYDLGMPGQWARAATLGLDLCAMALFVRFVRNEASMRTVGVYRLLEVMGLALLIVMLLLPYDGLGHWLEFALKLLVVLLSLAALLDCIRGYRRGRGVGRDILVALAVVIAGAVLNLFWAGNHWPLTPYHGAVTFVAVFLLYDVARNFKAMTLSMQSLSSRLVSIREKERARLTRDIHDGVGQGLSTLKLFITMNMNKFEPELGSTLKNEIDRTSTTLKSVIRNLKPIEVDNGSPVDALVELARHLCGLAGIELEVGRVERARMNPETAYQVYRVGQEALNNALKHSGASRISLDFERRGKIFSLSITDNGSGLSPAGGGEGYGLSSMRERALIVDGLLQVCTVPEGGTRIYLEVPIRD